MEAASYAVRILLTVILYRELFVRVIRRNGFVNGRLVLIQNALEVEGEAAPFALFLLVVGLGCIE